MVNVNSMFLILIETSGNQNYIFSTNKLKENVGASELTYQAGTRWVLEAVASITGEKSLEIWKDSKRLRKVLCDPTLNPPIEHCSKPVEILTAASGKALLLTQDQATAEKMIQSVTRKSLIEAPGLDVAGVYEEITDWNKSDSLAEAIKQVHKKFEQVRSRRPSPVNRFLRLPIIAACSASGLPASRLEVISEAQQTENKRAKPLSQVSGSKRDASRKAKERLTNIDLRLASQIDQLLQEDTDSEQRSWLAIVHADGNGLGQIFMNFEEYIGTDKSNRNYIEHYRKFSLSLDECTEKAFVKALDIFPQETEKIKKTAPVVPLIIGGDDLTVVCDGHYALEFTREFLQEFERQTEKHPGITKIAQQVFRSGRLSACAGVAVVKRHFPFSVAYDLAERLIKSAKDVKRKVTCKVTESSSAKTPFPCSAIDFHVLYDTSGIDLKEIRAKLIPQPGIQLYNRPYVVSEMNNLQNADGGDWAKLHEWKRLSDRVQWLNNSRSNHPDLAPISSGQTHTLRTALFLGKNEADAEYALIQQRYDLEKFAEETQSLFHKDHDGVYSTSFLDALTAMEFLKNAQSSKTHTEGDKTGVTP